MAKNLNNLLHLSGIQIGDRPKSFSNIFQGCLLFGYLIPQSMGWVSEVVLGGKNVTKIVENRFSEPQFGESPVEMHTYHAGFTRPILRTRVC